MLNLSSSRDRRWRRASNAKRLPTLFGVLAGPNMTSRLRWMRSSMLRFLYRSPGLNHIYWLARLTFSSVTRAITRDPTERASRPRKWLTYLTLFVAGAFLVGDAATLIYNVLGGEITIRFVLKVTTIAVIAGGIFTFFLSDMLQRT